ncbi:MAG: 3-deoxy-7-phosphoheptulonate synthase [Moraxellaceae bacterium]|nr:MAG: 3-deoxy-7-phosphoheptulonate synthase [Moraxellaceae bacterium]
MNNMVNNSGSGEQVENINIAAIQPLITPAQLKAELPLSDAAKSVVLQGRQTIRNILDGKDNRLFVVIGPCSIHDPVAAHDYADRLKVLSDKVKDTLYIVMRVYFEKPRTTVGWKGLINDPDMNDSFDIEKGLHLGRKLLLELNEKGLPCATEALDPNSPQYLQDLISWSAIGARTTESQTHREMSSGLSSPVGFKNGTDGGLTVAINAMQAVQSGHSFLGLNENGQVAVIRTNGNPYGHVVLRGGNGKPNYDASAVVQTEAALGKAKVSCKIMIDASHANSNKDPFLQPLVLENITQQIVDGNQSIVGLMVESHIKGGRQDIPSDLSQLEYGKSVTDGCIDWQTTEDTLLKMHEALKDVLPKRG